MTTDGAAAPLVAGVALLERALGYTRASLLLVLPDLLRRATPCRDWDLGALLAHMNDSLLALQEATTGGRVALDPPEERHGHPVAAVATLRARACRLLGDWNRAERDDDPVSVAGRPVAPSLVAVTGAVEIAVHGWDVAQACGRPRPIPSALAEELLDLAPLLVAPDGREGHFAAPVEVPPRSGAGDRLVAFLGRSPC